MPAEVLVKRLQESLSIEGPSWQVCCTRFAYSPPFLWLEDDLIRHFFFNNPQVVSRSRSRLELAQQEIADHLSLDERQAQHAMKLLECDIAYAAESDLKSLVQMAVDATNGPCDILVNCAGINRDALLVRTADQTMRDIIDTNLVGTMRITKHVVRHMLQSALAAGRSSQQPERNPQTRSIVNIGSVVGTNGGNVGQCVYSASKAALVGFTRTLAKEVGRRGIRVNLVSPGFIDTDMTAAVGTRAAQQVQDRVLLPEGRFGTPQEVANVVRFLASDDASYITGQEITVDGGFTIA